MATRPGGGTPTYPEFAVDDVQESPENGGQWNVQEPSPEVKSSGWRRLERPPRYWFNWLHRLYNLWIQWFDQEVEGLKSSVTNLISSLNGLASTTSTAITNLGTEISTHTHSGTGSTRIPPVNLQGVSVGDFVMTFTGFDANLNKPVRCAYKLCTDDWDGTEFASNPVAEIRSTRLFGLSRGTTIYFVNGQKMLLTVSGVLTQGSSTVVTVGGVSTASIPFNTDHATTMADIAAAVDALIPVFDSRVSGAYKLDIVSISGEVSSASAVTTGGTAVTWSLSAVYATWPEEIRPSHTSGGIVIPITVWNNNGAQLGHLSVLNDGTYGVSRQADTTPYFNGVWTTSANMGFEHIHAKYSLLG
jgi:hypothetical protein